MKIIVSLTTIPDRLIHGFPYKNVKNFYDTQLYKPDLIIVNIPAVSMKGVEYDKEKAYEFENIGPNVVVNWGVTDMGPITKLIPTLDYMDSNNIPEANIILIDDDCVYNKDLLSDLIEMRVKNPDKMAIGYQGFIYSIFVPLRLSHSNLSNIIECDALETYAGVLYDSNLFFPRDKFKKFVTDLPDHVKKADDIIIGAWIRKNGEKLYRTNAPIRVHHDAHDTIELRNTNLIFGNIKSMNYFAHKQYYGSECIIIQYSCTTVFVLLVLLVLLLILYTKKFAQ